MALDYIKVFQNLGLSFITVCRSEGSAEWVKQKTNELVLTGGVESQLERLTPPDLAVVAVGINELTRLTLLLLEAGVSKILVEKPAGLNRSDIEKILIVAEAFGAEVYVAYNRRFYSSTFLARKILEEDNGVLSFHFDFTELSREISRANLNESIKQRWVLSNSSHVIDLAFHLGGVPTSLTTFNEGCLTWHNSSSIFTGAGKTISGSLFSYHANWSSAGRWSLIVNTKNNRLIFEPIEKLMVMKANTFERENLELNDELDVRFKAGLFKQCRAFFFEEDAQYLCSIEEHLRNMEYYYKMASYE